MSTSSEVKAGLADIASIIRNNRVKMLGYKTGAAQVSTDLAALASSYSAVIAAINAYSAGTTDAFEMVSKAELAKLTTEFTALKTLSDAVAAINLG